MKSYIDLAALSPDDVCVQIYHGTLNEDGEINAEDAIPMESRGRLDDGTHLFEGAISSYKTGLHGYTVRILPRHDDLHSFNPLGVLNWSVDIVFLWSRAQSILMFDMRLGCGTEKGCELRFPRYTPFHITISGGKSKLILYSKKRSNQPYASICFTSH